MVINKEEFVTMARDLFCIFNNDSDRAIEHMIINRIPRLKDFIEFCKEEAQLTELEKKTELKIAVKISEQNRPICIDRKNKTIIKIMNQMTIKNFDKFTQKEEKQRNGKIMRTEDFEKSLTKEQKLAFHAILFDTKTEAYKEVLKKLYI